MEDSPKALFTKWKAKLGAPIAGGMFLVWLIKQISEGFESGHKLYEKLPEILLLLFNPGVEALLFLFGISLILWAYYDLKHGETLFDKLCEFGARRKVTTVLLCTGIFAVLGLCVGLIIVNWPKVSAEKKTANVTERGTTASPFYIVAGPALNTDKRNTLGYMVSAFETKRGEYTIVPINVWLHISLTNLQSVQSMIDAYGVEIRTKTGKWITLTRIETRNFQFYTIQNGLEHAQLLELVRLDSLLSSRWLQPKENARGWMFFEYPPGSDSDGFDFVFRVSMVDAAGIKFRSDVLTVAGNEGIQGAAIDVRSEIVDLRKAVIKQAN